ncbi:Stringent starvation protein B [Minicystis rosea]|nr:Stringent starvation protein B [Minicystis rosea]
MSNAPRQPPPKKEVALALLEESSMFIHLDPRRAAVVVPRSFLKQPQLVLQVGLNMAIPIPDLRVEDDGISCTLSFNRTPFWCKIPWTAIYALVGEDGRGGVWPDDVPPEIQLQQRAPGQQQKPAPSKRPRPRLTAVPDDAGEAPAAASPVHEAPEEKPEVEEEEPKQATPIRRGPVAVPAPAPAPAPRAEETSSADAPSAEEPPPAAEPAPSPSAGKKPKREIPPYLRVIK